jgi:hypothetical protein
MLTDYETVTPLSDWTLSEDHEPPSGELMYECETKDRTLLCGRSEIAGGIPSWGYYGVHIPEEVVRWRIVSAGWGLVPA